MSWAQEAEASFRAADDAADALWARDNQVCALVGLGQFEDAIGVMEEYRLEHVVDPGFSESKAVLYGNMFVAKLGLGLVEESEGFYFEALVNNIYLQRWYAIFRNLQTLLAVADSGKQVGLPEAVEIYRHLMALGGRQHWIGEAALEMDLFRVNTFWFYSRHEAGATDLAREALEDFVALGHLYSPPGFDDELSRRAGLFIDGATQVERKQAAAWLLPLLRDWPMVMRKVRASLVRRHSSKKPSRK